MRITTKVSGGQNIAGRLREIKEHMKHSNVYVGLPKGASYEDGAPIAAIGAVQEFGSSDGRIPERSFLRVPLRGNQKTFAKIFRKLMPMVLSGDLTMMQLLEQLGAKAVSVSQEAISAGIDPPNAPATILAKGSSTPLIDRGALRQSITYVVEGEEDES